MTQNSYDEEKVERIVEALMANPDGLWLRKLAEEADVPVSTLHRYVEGFLSPLIDNVGVRDDEGQFFGVRVIRLRSGVRKRLEEGTSFEKLMKMNDVIRGPD